MKMGLEMLASSLYHNYKCCVKAAQPLDQQQVYTLADLKKNIQPTFY